MISKIQDWYWYKFIYPKEDAKKERIIKRLRRKMASISGYKYKECFDDNGRWDITKTYTDRQDMEFRKWAMRFLRKQAVYRMWNDKYLEVKFGMWYLNNSFTIKNKEDE